MFSMEATILPHWSMPSSAVWDRVVEYNLEFKLIIAFVLAGEVFYFQFLNNDGFKRGCDTGTK